MKIGLTGYAETGKDAVADQLVEEFGFVKINMSDALDKYLRILNPYIAATIGFGGAILAVRYVDLVETVGYVEAKKHPEVRRLLQTLGTEVGRSIDPLVWVKELAKEAAKHDRVVTTGIRYRNEVTPSMTLIRVDRPGYGPLNDHSSEDLEGVFKLARNVIHNSSDLEGLKVTTRVMADCLGIHPV